MYILHCRLSYVASEVVYTLGIGFLCLSSVGDEGNQLLGKGQNSIPTNVKLSFYICEKKNYIDNRRAVRLGGIWLLLGQSMGPTL